MKDQRTAMVKSCPDIVAEACQPDLGKGRIRGRQWMTLAMVAFMAGACSNSDEGLQVGQVDYITGFVGGVAADEPRAAIVARDVLSAGGSAADAVTAAALTYAVTYPSAAGLGGGGFCVIADSFRRKTETIEFPAVAAQAGGSIAVPGLMRGLGLLQSRHGKLRWENVVIHAEQLARFGDGTSRALVRSATETRPPAAENPDLAPLLRDPRGRLYAEGETRMQQKLASSLARLRSAGAADFYQGALAQTFLADAAAGGGRITADELRAYAAQIGKPIELEFDNSMQVYTSSNAGGGAVAAWLIEQGFEKGGVFGEGKFLPARFAENIGQAYRGAGADAPVIGYGSSSIAAMDRNGLGVACAFSMGPAFGTKTIGRETGILFAAPPGSPGDESAYMAALVVTNPRIYQTVFAAAASGGAPAAAALAQTVLQGAFTLSDAEKKDAAPPTLAKPRLFHAGGQAPALAEAGADPAMLAPLRQRGIAITQAERLARVNMAYCVMGMQRAPETCSFAADRRGYGLAIGRQF